MNRARAYKWFLTAVGILSVGLALLGILVPLLPTTPFLLLAAGCFARSSQRFHDWLIHHRWFGVYIRNYRQYRAISARDRIVTLVLLWAGIGTTLWFGVTAWWVRLLLCAVAAGVTLHLVRLRTLTPEMTRRDTGTPKGAAETPSSEPAPPPSLPAP
jgi:hypothetical protein